MDKPTTEEEFRQVIRQNILSNFLMYMPFTN